MVTRIPVYHLAFILETHSHVQDHIQYRRCRSPVLVLGRFVGDVDCYVSPIHIVVKDYSAGIVDSIAPVFMFGIQVSNDQMPHEASEQLD